MSFVTIIEKIEVRTMNREFAFILEYYKEIVDY